MAGLAVDSPATETVGEQIASALRFLSQTARSSLERTVFFNAYLVCRGVVDQAIETGAALKAVHAPLPNRLNGDPLSALQYLEAEARRNQLQVAETILAATISIWMVASDIEMIRRHRETEAADKKH